MGRGTGTIYSWGGGGGNDDMPSDSQNLGGHRHISIPLRQKVGVALRNCPPPSPAPLRVGKDVKGKGLCDRVRVHVTGQTQGPGTCDRVDTGSWYM